MSDPELMARRTRFMGPNVPTFYQDPLHIVRGEGVWLYDAAGRAYLDAYNNVAQVGHCHPQVVAAIAAQAGRLNTHTRYMHDGVLDYIECLTATFDHDLSQAIMVCTGSEANDVALRMAEALTGKTGFIATDNTYHGNTKAVSQLSARRPPIGGYPSNVRLVPAPDDATLPEGGRDAQAECFAKDVKLAIDDLEAKGIGFAGLMLCPVFANEGVPQIGNGWLDRTAKVVRQAGGLLLVDEVQPGFGRIGKDWWGHQLLGVKPDVVTLGKPMGNGHPVAAVVTRPEIMSAFRNAFGYFNTFGGNPVSAAAAQATFDVTKSMDLPRQALNVGGALQAELAGLADPRVYDVRGHGLLISVELRTDGTPATNLASAVVEGMKDRGVLIGQIGREMHMLKIRPPLVFDQDHVDHLVSALAQTLASVPG